MRQLVRRFGEDERGTGLTEYALIVALVAICLVGIIQLARNAIGETMNRAAADVSRQSGGSYGATGPSAGIPALGNGSAPTSPSEPEEEEDEGEPADSLAASSPL